MKRVTKTKHDAIVEIPLIVRVRPVAVEPMLAVVVAFDVEHVRVAVRVGYYVHFSINDTAHRILFGLYESAEDRLP